MKIDKNSPADTYAHGAGAARRDTPTSVPAQRAAEPATVRRTDSVQFSPDGRALADVATISPERAAEIQARIRSGFYNSPDVAAAVAGKLVGRLGG